ncbi:MAG: hypothetical protein AAFZ18_34960 [Myxococcota bacterium]
MWTESDAVEMGYCGRSFPAEPVLALPWRQSRHPNTQLELIWGGRDALDVHAEIDMCPGTPAPSPTPP